MRRTTWIFVMLLSLALLGAPQVWAGGKGRDRETVIRREQPRASGSTISRPAGTATARSRAGTNLATPPACPRASTKTSTAPASIPRACKRPDSPAPKGQKTQGGRGAALFLAH